jgi:hypothetical protein
LHLPSHETLVVRLEPAPRSAEPLLVGCRLERLGGEAGAAQFRLLGLPGTAALVTLGRGGDRTALGRALLSAGLAQRGEQFEVSFPGGPAKPLAVADSAAASEGGSLRLCFTATVAKGVRAAAVVWAETAGLQATATLDGQPAGVEAPHLQVEDSKDPARTYEGKLYAQRESYGTTAKGPWSLFRVPLAPGANRVEFHLRSTDLDRVTVSLKQPAPLGPVPARVVTVHATGLVQVATDLAEGPVVQLPYPEHQAAAGPQLPGNWLREWRDTVRAVPREALTLSGQRPAEWYSLAPGAKLFTDDGSTVTSLPAAIEGQRGLAGSRAALLAGSGTSLRLDQPARLVVAFGHEGGAAGWLPPLPGWQRGPGGFATTDPSAGTELCWRDFPAGNVDLFVGSRGAWAIVAVLPQPTDLARGATLAASSLHDGTHLASLATDGSPKTEWWSVNGLPQWLRLDLPAPTWLNRVDLTFYHADRRHYQYRIDTSADGQTWDLAVDATGNTALATAEGTVHPFPRRQARSLRITVTGSSEIAAHVAEVRLYDDPLASAGSAR